ncbi:MAG: hypothetical protein KDC83_00705 [Flavobacteriales bacterium]|nr:hypothetical protein [Flavobacteriales bacterium]
MKLNLFLLLLFWSLCSLGQTSTNILKIEKPHKDIRIEYHVARQDTNIKHGRYRYFYRGAMLLEGNYHAGRKHGSWTRKYLNGSTSVLANYLNDLPHGKWKYLFPNGKVSAEITFIRGFKEGTWIGYHASGQVISILNYVNDTLSGVQKRYYPPELVEEGAPQPCIKEDVFLKQNHPNFTADIIQYYNNGKIYKKEFILENNWDGVQEKYYKSGILWNKTLYDKGKLISIYDWNYPVGGDAYRGTFRGGDGELKFYNVTGEHVLSANYNNGMMHGRFELLVDGKVQKEGFFSNGLRTGTWKDYETKTSKRSLIAEETFLTHDSSYTIDYLRDGQSRIEYYSRNGRKYGQEKRFDIQGKLFHETNNLHGVMHGEFTGYKNGLLNISGNYQSGLKTGLWSYYNDFGKVIFKEVFENKVSVDEVYFYGDSLNNSNNLENAFYNSSWDYITKKRVLSKNAEYSIEMTHYISKFNPDIQPSSQDLLQQIKAEFNDIDLPLTPLLVPYEITKRTDVMDDYDLGLILNSLNFKKERIKTDKTDPKLGVVNVLMVFDEFGFVKECRVVRGVDPNWNEKVKTLVSQTYSFWENAWFIGLPVQMSMELKIPVEYQLVKKLN